MVSWLALLCLAAEPTLSVEPMDGARHVRVMARLPAELAKSIPQGDLQPEMAEPWLTFALLSDDGAPGPAILGKYRRQGDVLTFTPRYALAHDHSYRATLFITAKRTETLDYRVPARKPTPPPVV